MKAIVAWAIAALAAVHVANASAADPCSLLSAGDASALLGQSSVKGYPAGPEKDEDSPGQMSSCTYRSSVAPASALMVSVVEFRSDAEARKYLTKNLIQSRMDDDGAKVTEEGGIAERSFYGATARGAMYVFLKKNKVVGVGLGGSPPAKSAVPKEALLKTAQAVASKV